MTRLSIVGASVEPFVRPHTAPDAPAPHSEPPTASVLGTVDARAVPVASTETFCAITGCMITAARNARRYCQMHDDAYLTRAYELTHEIGRGTR